MLLAWPVMRVLSRPQFVRSKPDVKHGGRKHAQAARNSGQSLTLQDDVRIAVSLHVEARANGACIPTPKGEHFFDLPGGTCETRLRGPKRKLRHCSHSEAIQALTDHCQESVT